MHHRQTRRLATWASIVRTQAWLGLTIACIAAWLPGCSRGPDLPPLAPARGTVTLDGRPLERGTVQFVPDTAQGTSGPPAVGTIQPNGEFELSTAGQPGAVVGFHKIRVVSQEEVGSEADAPISLPPSLIPAHYNNPDASGLKREVRAGEENVLDLKLSSAPAG